MPQKDAYIEAIEIIADACRSGFLGRINMEVYRQQVIELNNQVNYLRATDTTGTLTREQAIWQAMSDMGYHRSSAN